MKKLLTGILASAMVLSIYTSVSASTFTDVPETHWANSFIQTAFNANLVSGTGNGNFSPDALMNYGAFAVIMTNGAFSGETVSFDTDNHWSDPYLNVLLSNNLFQSGGNSVVAEGNSWQDQGISRENVATVIARLAELSGISVTGDLSTLSHFTDIEGLSDSQKKDIAIVLELGVMSGTSQTEFGTGATLNRASASVIIDKMLYVGLLTAKEGETSVSTTISGKVLHLETMLSVEDENGTLHNIATTEGTQGVSVGGMVNLTYSGDNVISIEQTSQGADVVGAYLEAWIWDSMNGLGNLGTVGEIVYWDLSGASNLSAAEKEIFLRNAATYYVDGVIHRVGTMEDMVADAIADGKNDGSNGMGNFVGYEDRDFISLSKVDGTTELFFQIALFEFINLYGYGIDYKATLNPTTGEYSLEAGIPAG